MKLFLRQIRHTLRSVLLSSSFRPTIGVGAPRRPAATDLRRGVCQGVENHLLIRSLVLSLLPSSIEGSLRRTERPFGLPRALAFGANGFVASGSSCAPRPGRRNMLRFESELGARLALDAERAHPLPTLLGACCSKKVLKTVCGRASSVGVQPPLFGKTQTFVCHRPLPPLSGRGLLGGTRA